MCVLTNHFNSGNIPQFLQVCLAQQLQDAPNTGGLHPYTVVPAMDSTPYSTFRLLRPLIENEHSRRFLFLACVPSPSSLCYFLVHLHCARSTFRRLCRARSSTRPDLVIRLPHYLIRYMLSKTASWLKAKASTSSNCTAISLPSSSTPGSGYHVDESPIPQKSKQYTALKWATKAGIHAQNVPIPVLHL